MDKIYLTTSNCTKEIGNAPIVVFGVGIDSDKMLDEIPKEINIQGFIDNYRCGTTFHGKTVEKVTDFCERRTNQKVIIASKRYTNEMLEQLESKGLEKGKAVFVWDNDCVFHKDDAINAFIELNNRIWDKVPDGKKNKILILFENRHLSRIVQEGYLARYFASMYDAEIWGINILDGKYEDASETMKEIYMACCGMKDVIPYQLSAEQEKKVDQLYRELWGSINTWEDWNSINIYDIHFGTTMMRQLQRFYPVDLEPKTEKMSDLFRKFLCTIVFWYDYFGQNDVKTVILSDGVLWEGYIRDIAITKGIRTYAIDMCQKLFLNHHIGVPYKFFGQFWAQLSIEEQEYGLKWAEQHVKNRINGSMEDIKDLWFHESLFRKKDTGERLIKDSDRIKILICPHIFEEDSYYCGEQLFDNNYSSWLCHVGELSRRFPEYDWYIKMHPDSSRLDNIFMSKFLEKYRNINRITTDVSPIQLKREGIDFALTICGSIGHEYPAIGIQVINAGENPGSCFSFNINPKSKNEYDEIIENLKSYINNEIDLTELYKFYCIQYLYYNWEKSSWKEIFFENELLTLDREHLKLMGKELGTWLYDLYLNEWSIEKHNYVLSRMNDLVDEMDSWMPSVFYRKEIVE